MNVFKIVLALVLMFGMVATGNAAAYMKLGDIKGEATDNEHKDWIIIESMSSPILRAHADIDATGQCQVALRRRGDTNLQDLVVVRELDKSSTKIQEAACGGATGSVGFAEVIIDVVSANGNKKVKKGAEPYLRYKLTNVIVTSYSINPEANGSGETVPMESFSLNYEEIKVTYTSQNDKKD